MLPRVNAQTVRFRAIRRVQSRIASMSGRLVGDGGGWQRCCYYRSRDANQIQFSQYPEKGWWFAGPSHRGSIRLACGVGMLTLPPVMPTFLQDDECFRRMAEPFIVFGFALPRDAIN